MCHAAGVEPRIRVTARALLVAPTREILLLRYTPEAIDRKYWITPGGALEPGETAREAVLREVEEETGLAGVAIGPPVWTRSVRIAWASPPFVQQETYFWVPCARFEPSRAHIPTESEQREIVDHRWWTLAELASSTERFAPRHMATLLSELLASGPPPAPIDVGA